MPVSKQELRSYLRPMLERAEFRFGNLRGMVDEGRLNSLAAAKGAGSSVPAEVIYRSPAAKPGAPDNFGLLLGESSVSGLPLYTFLSESNGSSLQTGLFSEHGDGRHIALNVTGAAGRLCQVLEYWLVPPGEGHPDAFRVRLVQADGDNLKSALERMFSEAQMKREEIPVLFALDVSTLRLLASRLEEIAEGSATPREFLCRALNEKLDTTLAHEMAHLQEWRCNGHRLPPLLRELFAYLVEALHANTADAYRSMMLNGFDITASMPSFDRALRALGPGIFHAKRGFLRGWAGNMLESTLAMLRMDGTKALADSAEITEAQTSDFIAMADMPLVERAMFNPMRNAGWQSLA